MDKLVFERGVRVSHAYIVASMSEETRREAALRVAAETIERFLEKSDMTVYLVLYDPASVAMGERLFGDVEALP